MTDEQLFEAAAALDTADLATEFEGQAITIEALVSRLMENGLSAEDAFKGVVSYWVF